MSMNTALRVALIPLAGLAIALSGCIASPDVEPGDEEVGAAESAYALPSLNGPFNGECVSTASISKVTTANGTVMRGTCAETCKRTATRLGAWSLHTYYRATQTSTLVDIGNGQKLGAGKSLSYTLDAPYQGPGYYYTACDMMFDEGKGPQFVQPFTETTALY